ncbi:MAG: hypothetical protein WC635_12790 [Bacteriovorax sp.]|jgi:hypothetical protein
MKPNIGITYFFIFALFSLISCANAKDVKTKKFIPQKYSNVVCAQKYIPLKIEQSLNSHLLTVKFTAQRKLDQFSIKNVRGIEGVTVTKFQELNTSDMQRGELLTSAVELSDFSGLVYVVFDVSIMQDGVMSSHSIPVPVGRLSAQQKAQRQKNVKQVITPGQAKEGTNSLSTPPQKIYEMQAE